MTSEYIHTYDASLGKLNFMVKLLDPVLTSFFYSLFSLISSTNTWTVFKSTFFFLFCSRHDSKPFSIFIGKIFRINDTNLHQLNPMYIYFIDVNLFSKLYAMLVKREMRDILCRIYNAFRIDFLSYFFCFRMNLNEGNQSQIKSHVQHYGIYLERKWGKCCVFWIERL